MVLHHIQVVLMEEALAFVRSLPLKAQEKITYNYKKVEQGIMDKELFKKLGNSNIWEFRTLYNGNCYRLFSFWDTKKRDADYCHAWYSKDNAENSCQGNRQSRRYKKTIFRTKRQVIMAQMKLIPLSDVVDEVWGKEGTPKRDAMETKLKAEVNSYYLGEAIRNTRLAQKLTQEELGGRIGVQRAQISRLEKGRTPISLQTMSRVFQALGVATATLDLGGAGKVALW